MLFLLLRDFVLPLIEKVVLDFLVRQVFHLFLHCVELLVLENLECFHRTFREHNLIDLQLKIFYLGKLRVSEIGSNSVILVKVGTRLSTLSVETSIQMSLITLELRV